jgi:hypothetical protein
MINGSYYILKNKGLAISISYLIGKSFYTYDDKFKQGKKVYSFEYTEEFKKALTTLTSLRKEFNN